MEDLVRLVQLTSNRIYALRERVEDALRQDFPSETPQILGRLLLQLVDKVNDELNQLSSELNTEAATSLRQRRTLGRKVRLCASSMRMLAPYLRYVEGARLEHNPWHIVGQFERLCRHIVPRARVIVRPKWKYNYESCWLNNDLRKRVFLSESELKPIFDRFPNFFALSYTSADSEDILQYAIWGHEIGHLYFQELNARDPGAAANFSQAITKTAPFDSDDIHRLLDFRFRRRQGIDPEDVSKEDWEKYKDLVVTKLSSVRNQWLSEISADLFAIRLFGPAPVLAFASLPLTDDELDMSTPSHPPPRLRMAEMLKQLRTLGYRDFFSDAHTVAEQAATAEVEAKVKSRWKAWHGKLVQLATEKVSSQDQSQGYGRVEDEEWKLEEQILRKNLREALPVIENRINREIDGGYFCSPGDMKGVFCQVEYLSQDLPPEVEAQNPLCLGLILTAGWLYWIAYGEADAVAGVNSYKELYKSRKRTNRLLSKGIEAVTVQAEFEERRKYTGNASRFIDEEFPVTTTVIRSGILSAPDLLARLNEPNPDARLRIMPLLEKDQIQADSIDLRLGNTFLVTRRTNFSAIDVTAGEDRFKKRIEQYQGQIYVPIGRPFYIHPGQFVLASSLEFVSIPRDLAGSLTGRTSWGRLGISVPTTSKVAPGFKGCLTIEIKNLGEVPVPLYPGVRIAQLRVETLSREASYQGRYDVPTSTEFSRIYEDSEMKFLGELRLPLVIGVTGLAKSGLSRVVNYLREEGYSDQSLKAIYRDEMRRSGWPLTKDDEKRFVLKLRRNEGNTILARLLLEKLEAIPHGKVVVEGIERVEEVEFLANRTRFFLIGIKAPFGKRRDWWNQDYVEKPISEEDLKKHDLWELDGMSAEGEESEDGAPNIRACLEKADYIIENNQDKANVHEQVERILAAIIQEQNLYGFEIM